MACRRSGSGACRGTKTCAAFTVPTTCWKCARCRPGPGFATFFTEGKLGSRHSLNNNLNEWFLLLTLWALIRRQMIAAVNHTNPDIVWIGFSTPEQEIGRA